MDILDVLQCAAALIVVAIFGLIGACCLALLWKTFWLIVQW